MYEAVKSLHIIFMVSWFAGLFYMVRLFVYHVEAKEKPENEREVLVKQYKIMEKRLWYIITWPAMIGTIVFGVWMLFLPLGMAWLKMGWMHMKLGFVVLLIVYHFLCHGIFKQHQKDVLKYSSTQFRIWNEVATLLLVAIVFLVVMKNGLNTVYGVVGFFGTAILLMMGIKLYKKLRSKPS